MVLARACVQKTKPECHRHPAGNREVLSGIEAFGFQHPLVLAQSGWKPD
jgi:hypothetical protein